MARQPLGEVFGFPIENLSAQAEHYRQNRLCPFNNKVPSCTKDRANDPLGVCSVNHNNGLVITCPIRFRQDWRITVDAKDFFFPLGTTDGDGLAAGNIDVVLVSYDDRGRLTDFGALEVQAVYISGNVRKPFEYYMQNRNSERTMDWSGMPLTREEAELVWLIYDLEYDPGRQTYALTLTEHVYSKFGPALERITKPRVGPIEPFIDLLQSRLDTKLAGGSPPDAPTLLEIVEPDVTDRGLQ